MTGWEYADATAAVCGAIALGGVFVAGGAVLLVGGIVGLVMIAAITIWAVS